MRFKGLDLNLLQALDVLLHELSVSAAAQRLSVTQPAMSAILSRLREYFCDDLLILHNRRMYPTAFAQALHPKLRDFIRSAEDLISNNGQFYAKKSERTFYIGASDYLQNALLFDWIEKIRPQAPNVNFDIGTVNDVLFRQFERAEVDVMVLPEEFASDKHPADLLFEEQHVVVGRSDNPLLLRPMTEAELFDARHVAFRIGPSRRSSFADRHLELMQKSRRIAIALDTFMAAPQAIVALNCLAVVQKRLAHRICRHYPLAYAPLPFEFPVMREMMQFHQSRVDDEGGRWLRSSLKASVHDGSMD